MSEIRYLPLFTYHGDRFFLPGVAYRTEDAAVTAGYTEGLQVALATRGRFTGEALALEIGKPVFTVTAKLHGRDICIVSGPTFEQHRAAYQRNVAEKAA